MIRCFPTILPASPCLTWRWLLASLSGFLILSFCLALPSSGLAALEDSIVDPTFKTGAGPNKSVTSLVVQSDGKIIIGGQFTSYGNVSRSSLARLHIDGSLDASFNTSNNGIISSVTSLAIQPDGKIILGGYLSNYTGTAHFGIARLNADGSVDTSFNFANNADYSVSSLAIQPDGKIIISGSFHSPDGSLHAKVVRLNADGSLDATFSSAFSPDFQVNDIALTVDGKVILGGYCTNQSGVARTGITRLNADGSLDTSFNPGSGVNNTLNSLAVQSDGKIIIGGQFTRYNGITSNRIARLNTDGSLDTSFNLGSGTDGSVNSLAIQSDNKIIVGGYFSNYNGVARNNIARLNADGSLDTSFDQGAGTDGSVNSLALQTSNAKIIIGGQFTSYRDVSSNKVARLNPDGSLDTSFDSGGSGANGPVYTVAIQNDSKIIVGGRFTRYNGVVRNYIARVNTDGSLDSSFDSGGSGANGYIEKVVIQSDGKIIISGAFSHYNGTVRFGLARLNADGSLDSSFKLVTGESDFVRSLAVQSDSKIVVGGYSAGPIGIVGGKVLRLNPDGSLDSSFNPGSGVNQPVESVAIQSDGKILIGGFFTSYNGAVANKLARLNPDGSLDSSFNSGTGVDGMMKSIVIYNSTKILIGGYFATYNGVAQRGIARLNMDGSLDDSFHSPGRGNTDYVDSLVIQSDGKIVSGGCLSVLNGAYPICNEVDRLNPDGSFDSSFAFKSLPNERVKSVAIQSDGKIVISGLFTSVDGYTSNSLARLENIRKTLATVEITSSPNPSNISDSVTFTATLTPLTASGTVQFIFSRGGNKTSVTTTLVDGLATYVTTTLPVGETLVTALYSGDSKVLASSSLVYAHNVAKIATSLSLVSSPNPAQAGSSVTFTATLSPVANPASGVVIFSFNRNGLISTTSPVPVVNGLANYLTTTLPAGTYSITATYSGDANYASSTSAQYSQVIVAVCNPRLVTSISDDGQANSCGTLSYALATTTAGTISFALPAGNTITFSGSLTTTLLPGVIIDGGVDGIVLDGNGVNGDGLQLGGGNQLINLTIKRFGGRELVALVGGAANHLFKVKVQS